MIFNVLPVGIIPISASFGSYNACLYTEYKNTLLKTDLPNTLLGLSQKCDSKPLSTEIWPASI